MSYPLPSGPTTASSAIDRSALSRVGVAALLGLITGLLSVISLVVSPTSAVFSISTGSSGSSVSLNVMAFSLAAAVAAAEFVMVLLAVWFYREAFRELSTVDARFPTPSTLTLMAFIALLILAMVGVALFAVIYQAIICAGSGNPIPSSCISFGEILGLLVLLFVVAIVLLIGAIGLLIGIWRLGTRYQEGLLKVAAILLILPVLNIVGFVLILVASRSLRNRIGSGPPVVSFG